jgi:O-antigen/teichoic acid export membrane protein
MFDFRKLAANFSFLVVGEIISKIFTFAAFAFLARTFGPLQFGHLEFVLAVMIFATLLVDFGANPLGSREVAQARERIGEIVASLVGMRAILSFLTYGLLFGFALIFLNDKPQLKNLMLLYGLSLFFITFFFQFVFQGLEKMKWVAISSVVRQMVFAAGVFLVVIHIKRLWVVACIEITAVFSLTLYSIYMLIFHVKTTGFKTNTTMLWRTFKEALPIGLSDITWAFMWYFATILLGLMTTGNEVGWFSAAHRPVMTLHTFVWLYFCNLLPSISRSAHETREVLDNLMRHSMSFMSWGTVLIGAVGLTMAEPLIVLVFGNKFRESAAVIKILIWMIPLSSLGCHYRYTLIGYGRQNYEFIAHAVAAVVSVIMGFILIPIYAEKGAALSLVIAVSVYCLLVYLFVKANIHHIPFLPHVSKPILGCVGMVGLFFTVSTYSLWLAIMISVVFYISAMMILQPEIRKISILIISRQDETKLGDLTSP